MSFTKFPCKIESGVELFTRLKKRPTLGLLYPEIFGNNSNCGDVIEISYEHNTFYPYIVNELISNVIFNQDGESTGVILISTDGHFDMMQLTSILNNRLRNQLPSNTQTENIRMTCLKNLHIINVCDWNELQLAISSLENLLASDDLQISIVLLDTVVAFYWSDHVCTSAVTKMDDYLESIITNIKNASRAYNITLIYIKPSYFVSGHLSEPPDLDIAQQDELHARWNVIDWQITLIRDDTESGSIKVTIRRKDHVAVRYFKLSDKGIGWM